MPLKRLLEPLHTVVQWLETHGVVKRQQDLADYLSPTFQTFVAQQAVPGLLQAPPLTLEPMQRTALQRGRVIKLSPAEFDLLALLIRQEGKVLSGDEIMLALWPTDQGADNAERLKDLLKGLRRLLDKDAECIQNVRGQGYFFRRLA